MRIAGTSYNTALVQQLNQLTVQQYQLQNQASTGLRIQKPEDDPAGMAQALSLQTQNSQTTQYSQNISTLQTRAQVASNALQSLKSVTDRAAEIATQADGTASPTQLQAFASEVNQLIQQAVQMANTQNGNEYVFGGTDTSQAPFTATTDASGNVTAVTYQGNTQVANSEIAPGTTMSVDAPGENNSGAGPRGLLSDSRYGADLFNHLIALQQDLASGNTNAISSTDAPALTNDDDNVIYQIAQNGVGQTRLETAASTTTAQQDSLQQNLTNVTGADLTQTLTQLSQNQNTYQAALASTSMFLSLQNSLFQYL